MLLFSDLSHLLTKSNPFTQAHVYIDDKVSKHKGILNAFADRRSNLKTYANRCEMRQMKQDKMQASTESSTRFELQNEIDSLNKEINDLKKNIIL